MNFSPPIEIAGWLACCGFVLWIINLGTKLADRMRGKPAQPSNTSLGATVTDISRRVIKLEDWRDQLVQKLEKDKIEILTAGENRATRLHERMDMIDTTVNNLPDRVIATLRNTGAI